MCGCGSGAIGIWELSTGECVRTLHGHTQAVSALAVHGNYMMSASMDKTVRVWCLESGACLRVLQAFPAESRQWIQSLAVVSGRKLVGVAPSETAEEMHDVVVWDMLTGMEEQRVMRACSSIL